jgi:pyruvate/2-oxoglutarate/acetoin dehydrogenase E1 component
VGLFHQNERLPDSASGYHAKQVQGNWGIHNLVKRTADQRARCGVCADAEVIDLPTLDRDTVGDSIDRTKSLMNVGQVPIPAFYSTMPVDECQRGYMDWLGQPVRRDHYCETSPTIFKVLERAALADNREGAHGLVLASAAQGTPIDGTLLNEAFR